MSIHKSIGAIFEENHCEFRLWAPKATKAKVHLLQDEPREFIMTPEDHGYWSITIENISPGIRYLFSIDDQPPLPDPASRFQPDGVHEASEAINPDEYSWNDAGWTNMPLNELIIYELHTGTFSESSDFKGIADKIPYFKELGINAIEIMPVSQFPGERNWGYDGVYPFAVQNSYGGPSELMKLVDTCHNEGIAVILDVVYNHLGPEGNYLEQFAPYFTEKYKTPWGKAVNFDDRYSDGFRNYVVQNALMWFRDFHIDALRLDAVHAIYDFSAKHIMREIAEETRKLELDVNRKFYLIAESDLNDVKYINPFEIGGYGLDMQWADDFHHALHALFTGEKNGYYSDFGTLEGLMKAIQSPFVYNGVYSNFRKRTYGNSSRKNPSQQFIVFSQNHDQVGNRMKGERLSQLISFELAKVAAGIVLTSPYTPMLFMGEEYFEQNPFQYFVSHNDPELNRLVEKGRKREFESFYKNASEDVPAPADIQTFKRSLLSWSVEQDELSKNMFNVYKALILLRKNYPTIHATPRSEIELHKTLNGFISDYQFNENQTLMVFNLSEEDGDVTITMKTKGVLKKIFDSADQKWAGPGTSLPHTIQTADIINIRAESFAIFSNI